jgi:hypothetical protein
VPKYPFTVLRTDIRLGWLVVLELAAALALAVTTLLLCDGAHDQLCKDFEINIAELPNVQASLAHLVLTESRNQLLLPEDVGREVDGDVVLSRGETRQARVAFATAVIPIVIAAEPDDARPPHLRLLFRRLRHQLRQRFTVLAAVLVFDGGEVASTLASVRLVLFSAIGTPFAFRVAAL